MTKSPDEGLDQQTWSNIDLHPFKDHSSHIKARQSFALQLARINPRQLPLCANEAPALKQSGQGHWVACHLRG